ncbi:agouti-signaling protein 2b [Syngnathus typhle]|uniref:agouti-signaling protein 2b n=1 Tax=Syngnathus typhle TaxID=161592 RepID=UPI002A69CD36|nr:agouti-signaling protein 2b [Syngnathus typhle]
MIKTGPTGNYLCFLLFVITLCDVVDAKKHWRQQRDIGEVLSQVNTRRLFARQKISRPMESHRSKCKSVVTASVRSCSLLRESCSPNELCCGSCSFCRCRFFNIICRCWKNKPPCLRGEKIPCMSF